MTDSPPETRISLISPATPWFIPRRRNWDRSRQISDSEFVSRQGSIIDVDHARSRNDRSEEWRRSPLQAGCSSNMHWWDWKPRAREDIYRFTINQSTRTARRGLATIVYVLSFFIISEATKYKQIHTVRQINNPDFTSTKIFFYWIMDPNINI